LIASGLASVSSDLASTGGRCESKWPIPSVVTTIPNTESGYENVFSRRMAATAVIASASARSERSIRARARSRKSAVAVNPAIQAFQPVRSFSGRYPLIETGVKRGR
jgi:hypothetical protein